MDRVIVIGSPGAGKSTLATELARLTELPLFHLDQMAWLPGWVESDRAAFRARVDSVIEQPRWIIDGNYGGSLRQRLARADTVIDLDLPGWLCLARTLKRIWTSHGRVRADMAPGCPEQFDLAFLAYIARFPGPGRRKIEANLARFSGERIRLRRPAEVQRFLAGCADVAPALA
jgi:adenylate kinase family enzyme